MNPNTVFLVAMTVVLSAYSIACRSTSPQNSDQEFNLTNQKLGEDEIDEFDGDESADSVAQSIHPLAHPKDPTAWATRRLIMTTAQPSPRAIQKCEDMVESLAKSATNLEALSGAATDLRADVTKDKSLYHWCFYQMMASLDEKMDQPLSLMDEKADLFLDKMSRLWILAGALDSAAKSNVYVKYLKTRYTSISLQTFGRLLETMDSGITPAANSNRGKSAEYFFDE